MPYLLAFLTSVFYGVSDFAGGVLTKRVSEYAVTGAAAAVAGGAIAILGVGTGTIAFDRIDLRAGALSGIFLLIGTVLYLRALSKGRMGVIGGTATLLVLVPLIFDIRNGLTPSTLALVGIAVTIGGVVLLGAPEMRGGSGGLGPVYLAVVAALFFGLSQVALGIGVAENVLGTMLAAEVAIVLVIGVLGLFVRSVGGLDRTAIPLILVVGITDALALWTFSTAATSGNLAVVSTLSALDPIVIALLALFFLKERMTRLQVVAIGIVIAGGVLLAVGG